jgi:hypothetical protein
MWHNLSRNSKEIIFTILFIYYVGALGHLSFLFSFLFYFSSKLIHPLVVGIY